MSGHGVQEGRVAYRAERVGAPPAFVRHGAWDRGGWTGPWQDLPFAATEIIPSWTASTPPGSWIRVELQVPGSQWYVMGRWSHDGPRTSAAGQSDALGRVAVDVFKPKRPVTRYRLRAWLYAPPAEGTPAEGSPAEMSTETSAAEGAGGVAVRPRLRTLGAVASTPGGGAARGGVAWGRELAVPRKSQLAHAGHGGGAWCSPTATAMVIAYWKRGPAPADTRWVAKNDPDPAVDHAARHTFDTRYQGTGNWAFNTAYAGTFGLDSRVTRMRSLAEAEELIAAGVPVVASLAFAARAFGYGSSGHLMVITGFTRGGDVIVNDPAVRTVRAVYPRAAFERAWRRGSNGTAYVIRPFRADG
ncbi:C39 family peptidase [Nonomuraea sp. NBC_01738]|uniref:C39 family peptidase n=1 Tax=Nonomuraea sp. NBC_01738 TaxID=2976003 RepID=UPI002E0DC224|nr:C39 family peptidase [Nonomuraea sp. NBC_01738]